MKGPLREVFDHRQYITDVSGAGNNWAEGHMYYGQKYRSQICELVRNNAEQCDSLESFFIMHSMGGGTGSGLGTSVLKMLADEFADVHRFVGIYVMLCFISYKLLNHSKLYMCMCNRP